MYSITGPSGRMLDCGYALVLGLKRLNALSSDLTALTHTHNPTHDPQSSVQTCTISTRLAPADDFTQNRQGFDTPVRFCFAVARSLQWLRYERHRLCHTSTRLRFVIKRRPRE